MSKSDSSVTYQNVQDFPGYRVGSDGSVWTSKKCRGNRGWRRMSLSVHPKCGHLYVRLCRDGRHYPRYVHRLVLEAFVGKRPRGMEACHAPDRNPANNDISNLRWDTAEGTTLAPIAAYFGTDQSTVSAIVRRKKWAHLPDFQAGRLAYLESKGKLHPIAA